VLNAGLEPVENSLLASGESTGDAGAHSKTSVRGRIAGFKNTQILATMPRVFEFFVGREWRVGWMLR
jgi:hypothetical protein